MKLTLFLAFALATLCASGAAEQAVSPVAFSEYRHVITAFSPTGEILLPVVRVQLDIHYPRGKKERGNLVVVYDPATEHYFWRYASVDHPGDTASFLDAMELGAERVYAGPEALDDFYMPKALYVKEHAERAASLDAAEKASIEGIRRGLAAFEAGGYHTDAKDVVIGPWDRMDFYCAPLHDNCVGNGDSIVSISPVGDNLRLVLRNRYDQEVILDPKFNQISTRRLTEPKDK